MDLVFRVEGQLVVVTVVDVNVCEGPLLTVLDDPLVLDVVLQAQFIERVGHQGLAVAENVNIDVGPFADVPGADAADQPGAESGQRRIRRRASSRMSRRCS